MNPIFLLMAGFALVAAAGKKRAAASAQYDSRREDVPHDSLTAPIDPVYQAYVPETLLSWLYYWGGPKMPVPGLKRGANLKGLLGDCAGLLYCLQIEAGVWPEDFVRGSDYLNDPRFVRVSDDQIRVGDVLCYPDHVALCVGGTGLGCTVWSDSGGHRTTLGDDPNARPKLFVGPRRYRSDFVAAVRLK